MIKEDPRFSQLTVLIKDIVSERKSGVLSGVARIEANGPHADEDQAAETSIKFSLLFKTGTLGMCQVSQLQGMQGLELLLKVDAILRISWFAMETALLIGDSNEPVHERLKQALPITLGQAALTKQAAQSSSAFGTTLSGAAFTSTIPLDTTLEPHVVLSNEHVQRASIAFEQVLGDDAHHFVQSLLAKLGKNASAQVFVKRCQDELAIYIGDEAAREFF